MAARLRNSLLILSRALRESGLLLLIGALILIAFGVERIFARLEADQAKKTAYVVGSLLRDESTLSRSYLLAQSIEDMVTYGVIKCAKLSRVSGTTTVFYDSTFKADCPKHSLETVLLPGLDGNRWEFKLAPHIDTSFFVIKWLTVFVSSFLLIVIYVVAQRMIKKERAAAELNQRKHAFLEELTQQVRHDVASPMSALNMIAARAPLDQGTKAFLQEAIRRAESIFRTLQMSEIESEIIDIRTEFTNVLQEKVSAHLQFPNVTFSGDYANLRLARVEFGRVISNLLTNSFESGATTIEVSFATDDTWHSVSIVDNGSPIPATVLARLGERGNSAGKANGSGLGLYHAIGFMNRNGGELTVSQGSKKNIILKFPLNLLQ